MWEEVETWEGNEKENSKSIKGRGRWNKNKNNLKSEYSIFPIQERIIFAQIKKQDLLLQHIFGPPAWVADLSEECDMQVKVNKWNADESFNAATSTGPD